MIKSTDTAGELKAKIQKALQKSARSSKLPKSLSMRDEGWYSAAWTRFSISKSKSTYMKERVSEQIGIED